MTSMSSARNGQCEEPVERCSAHATSRRSWSGTGSWRSSTPWTSAYMAVLPAMPTARVSTAAAVKPFAPRRLRQPARRSCPHCSRTIMAAGILRRSIPLRARDLRERGVRQHESVGDQVGVRLAQLREAEARQELHVEDLLHGFLEAHEPDHVAGVEMDDPHAAQAWVRAFGQG